MVIVWRFDETEVRWAGGQSWVHESDTELAGGHGDVALFDPSRSPDVGVLPPMHQRANVFSATPLLAVSRKDGILSDLYTGRRPNGFARNRLISEPGERPLRQVDIHQSNSSTNVFVSRAPGTKAIVPPSITSIRVRSVRGL